MLMKSLNEIKQGLISRKELNRHLKDGQNVILRGSKSSLLVGKNALIKIAVGFGISREIDTLKYINLLKKAYSLNVLPHIIMDFSNMAFKHRLFKDIAKNFNVVVATVPIYYSLFNNKKGIDANQMLEEIEFEAESGVGYINLHLTPNKNLFEKACKMRKIPCTSMGGGLVIRDLYINKREFNVFADNLDKICSICKKNKTAISLAISFRSPSVIRALDDIYLQEMKLLKEYVEKIRGFGVSVISECFGHIYLKDIKKYAGSLKKLYNVPMQPLGPVLTDTCVGHENIAAAIGACFMSFYNCADIFFAVTRDEHSNHVPTESSYLEALNTTYVATQTMNIYRFPKLSIFDKKILENRFNNLKCGVTGGKFLFVDSSDLPSGCEYCEEYCPLMLKRILNKKLL